MNARTVGTITSLGLALCASQGRAEGALPSASLRVHAQGDAQGCISERQLEAAIAAQLSAPSAKSSAQALRFFDITIEKGSLGYVADLRVSGKSDGFRRIEATQCAGLLDALSVTCAMILDQDLLDEPQKSIAAPGENASTEPSNLVERPPLPKTTETKSGEFPTAPSRAPRKPTFQGMRLGAGRELRSWIGGGVGSTGAFSLETGIDLYVNQFGATLGGFYRPERSLALGTGRVHIASYGGLAGFCWRRGVGVAAVACLRGTVGGERVEGAGFDEVHPARVLTTAEVGPSLGFELVNRWVFGLDLRGQVSLLRDRYVVSNVDEEPVAPLAALWLVARVGLTSRK